METLLWILFISLIVGIVMICRALKAYVEGRPMLSTLPFARDHRGQVAVRES